jgi:hypothetical protein
LEEIKIGAACHDVLETKGVRHETPKLRKTYIIENKMVIMSSINRVREKGELKMPVDPTMLLKTHGEKMSVMCHATMLMKTNGLKS